VRALVKGRPRRSVVFIVGRQPGRLAGLVAVGQGSYLNELFEIAGGTNIFAKASQQYLKISVEELLARNPDVIIDMGEMADTVGVSEEQKNSVVALWSKYPSLKAVQGNGVHAVASDIFVVPGPRIAEAAEAFARLLHPEAAR
jgi:iron complex transport system substrate-binding protein